MADLAHAADQSRRIDLTASRAAALVDELLDLTLLEMGRTLELDRAPVDFISLLRRVVAEHRQASVRHELRVDSSDAQLIGQWDARRLVRVLSNLLDNAIKYSPDGGEIKSGCGANRRERRSTSCLLFGIAGLGFQPTIRRPCLYPRVPMGFGGVPLIAANGDLVTAETIHNTCFGSFDEWLGANPGAQYGMCSTSTRVLAAAVETPKNSPAAAPIDFR